MTPSAFLVEWSDEMPEREVELPDGPWEPVTLPTIEREERIEEEG